MAKKIVKLDLADAQFVGYCAGKDGRILDMVQAMGLTKYEWRKWKENYTTTYLTDREVKEIDDHFNLSVMDRVGF